MSALRVPVSVGDHVVGVKNAVYILVEYGDLQCPDTASVEPDIQDILQEMDGKAQLAYRHYPLVDIHPYAYQAAEAVEAAGAQGKFWEMRQVILDNQERLDMDSLTEFARDLRLDIERFERDVTSHAFAGKIDADIQSAVRSGVEGTPTFFLNDNMIDPSEDIYDVMESLEEEAQD